MKKLQEYAQAKLNEQESAKPNTLQNITLSGTKKGNQNNYQQRNDINIFNSYQAQSPNAQQALMTSLKQKPSQLVNLEATINTDQMPMFMYQINERMQQQFIQFVEKTHECLGYQQKRYYEYLIQQFSKLSENKMKQIEEVYRYKYKVTLQDEFNNIQTPLYKTTLINLLMNKKNLIVRFIKYAIQEQNLSKLITYIFLFSEDDMQQVLHQFQQYTKQDLYQFLQANLEDGYCKQIILHYLKSLVQEQQQILINNEQQFIAQLVQYLEQRQYQQFLTMLLGISNHIYPQISVAIWMNYQRPLNEMLKQHFERFDLECLLMFHEHKNGHVYGMAYALQKSAQMQDIDEITKIALLIKGEHYVEQAYNRMYGDIQQLLSTYQIVNAILQFKQQQQQQ